MIFWETEKKRSFRFLQEMEITFSGFMKTSTKTNMPWFSPEKSR